MHAAGISHYDLNAHNIILRNEDKGDLVIIDFEYARDDIEELVELQPAVIGFSCCSTHIEKLKRYCMDNRITIQDWRANWPDEAVAFM